MKRLITLFFLIGVFTAGTFNNVFGQYCTPTFNYLGNYGMGTVNVTIGSISNISTTPNSGTIPAYITYSNYTFMTTTHCPSATVNFNIQVGPSNSTCFRIYVDWNDNFVFDASDLMYTSPNTTANGWVSSSFVVPAGAPAGPHRMRLISDYGYYTPTACGPMNYGGEAEDYTFQVPVASNMTFDSGWAEHPDTTPVFPGLIKAKILKINARTSGCNSPLRIDSIFFSTSGTTNAADLSRLRIYTQDGAPLNDAYLYASYGNPNGVILFAPAGGLQLNPGVNSLWLAYDISSTATMGNVVDFSVDSFYIGGVKYNPTIKNPPGNRRILSNANFTGYCSVTRVTMGNYAIGIKKVTFESINNATQTWPGPAIYNFFPTPIPTVWRQKTYPLTINHGELNTQAAAVYVDWDNDGYFNGPGEFMWQSGYVPEATVSRTNLTIPCNALPGIHRMRVVGDQGTPPLACGNINLGEVEDYLINVGDETNPVVSYTKADTVGYLGSEVVLTPVSNINGFIQFDWDFDNDGLWDLTSNTGRYTYTTSGYKVIKLQAVLYGCYGTYYSNIYTDSVKIIVAPQKPIANFIANINVATPNISINLTDLSTFGPNKWKWIIEPDSVQGLPAYTITPSDTAQNPTIRFSALGIYDATLIVSNSVGTDTNIKIKYLHAVKEMIFCQDVQSRLPSGYLYDNGGKYNNYTNPSSGQERTCGFLINPKCATAISLDFLDFDVCSYGITACPLLTGDNVKVFDGVNNSGIPLHLQFLDILGTPIYPIGFTNGPNNILRGLPPTSTATSGSMYVQFYVNCMALASGFEARWSSQLFSPNPPNASISGDDTLYTKKPGYYHSTSTGYDLDYNWDFNGDEITDSYDSAAVYVFQTAGTYNVRLIITSCEFKDTAYFTVIVNDPTSIPVVNFMADFTRVTVNDLVTFTDLSDNTVYQWRWRSNPNKFVFQPGSDSTKQNPVVRFSDTGYYDITLVGTNALGASSITKNDYIHVYKQCKPIALNVNSDVGMSEVIIKNPSNTEILHKNSNIGQFGYSDYSYPNKTIVYNLATYELTIKRITNFNKITWTVWIDYNQDGIFSSSERIGNVSNTSATTWTINFTVPGTAFEGNALMRIAANEGILGNSPCGPNFTGEFEDYGLLITKDKVPPVITLTPPDTLVMSSCATYTEPGYMAMDDVDADITSNVLVTGTINSLVPGYYYKRYNVSDKSGNAATQVTRVIQVLRDYIQPTITLNGNNPDSFAVGTNYTDPGHVTTDDCSGISSDSVISNVNKLVVGNYTITYKAKDKSIPYNERIVTRTVVCYDKINPGMTLNGLSPMYVEVNTPFTDPGVTITDNYYTSLVPTITGSVNSNQLGTYFLTYCVTDPSGNGPVCLDRTVIVRDKVAPVITLLDDTLIILDVQTKYNEPGYTLTDNYWSANDIIVNITGTVNTFVLGDYILLYQAIDASGNVSGYVKRTVRIVDRIAPTIQLVGPTSVSLRRWATYLEPGVSVVDNYYPASQLTIQYNLHGTYQNTQQPGLYSYTYKACDPSSNCSEEIYRLIYVFEDQQSTGQEEQVNGYQISYFPNPAKDLINIGLDLPESMPVSINFYDAVGKLVLQAYDGELQTKQFSFDISSLNSGAYYIKFTIGATEINRKFIIAR